MSTSITVHDMDPGDKSWLRREARQIGVSMEELVRLPSWNPAVSPKSPVGLRIAAAATALLSDDSTLSRNEPSMR